MLTPTVRAALGPADLAALTAAIARAPHATRDALAQTLDQEGIDGVVAHPAFDLDQAFAPAGPGGLLLVSLPFYVFALVHQALARADVREVTVSDYVATLILEFGHGARAYQLDQTGEHPIETLTDVVAAEMAGLPDVATAQQHRGNFALWLAGLFPDRITARVRRRGAPGFEYYDAMGREGFAAAADQWRTHAAGVDTICVCLAGHFTAVRRALNAIADTRLFPGAGPDPVERLLRQVSRA